MTGVSELAERTRSALQAVEEARQALRDSHGVVTGIIERLTPLLAGVEGPDAAEVLAQFGRARDAIEAELRGMD